MTTAPTGWTFAAAWDRHAEDWPGDLALGGPRDVTWEAFRARAHALADSLTALGCRPGDRVGVALGNGPEYLEVCYALSVAGLVHANTNHRYGVDEVMSLWSDLDVRVAVVDDLLGAAADEVAARRGDLRVVHVDATPAGTGYEALIAAGSGEWQPAQPRDGDDEWLICTGGTTGRPKGVRWRQSDLFLALRNRAFGPGTELPADLDAAALARCAAGSRLIGLPASPLMHATGLANALASLMAAGTVVTVPGRFDPQRILDAAERSGVQSLTIVGDAFALPMLAVLDASPDRWQLPALRRIISAGMRWSTAAKERLLDRFAHIELIDTLGASEAIGLAVRTSSPAAPPVSADEPFTLGPSSFVVSDDGVPLDPPASGHRLGRIAMHGHVPVGYLGDEERSRRTFPVIDGRRCSVPGDVVELLDDGRVRLIGRGSSCINTAGEKVYADEVEGVLAAHPDVRDVGVIGTADERFGEVVTAVVEAHGAVDTASLHSWAHARLAGYKVPRRWVIVDELGRGANGKLDLRRLMRLTDSTS